MAGAFGLALTSLWLLALTAVGLGRSTPGSRASRTLMASVLAGSLGFSIAYPFPVSGLVLVAIAVAATRASTDPGIDPAHWTPDPLAASPLARRGPTPEATP